MDANGNLVLSPAVLVAIVIGTISIIAVLFERSSQVTRALIKSAIDTNAQTNKNALDVAQQANVVTEGAAETARRILQTAVDSMVIQLRAMQDRLNYLEAGSQAAKSREDDNLKTIADLMLKVRAFETAKALDTKALADIQADVLLHQQQIVAQDKKIVALESALSTKVVENTNLIELLRLAGINYNQLKLANEQLTRLIHIGDIAAQPHETSAADATNVTNRAADAEAAQNVQT